MAKCRLCGKTAYEIQGYLKRVNGHLSRTSWMLYAMARCDYGF